LGRQLYLNSSYYQNFLKYRLLIGPHLKDDQGLRVYLKDVMINSQIKERGAIRQIAKVLCVKRGGIMAGQSHYKHILTEPG
jgi:hypothetical protein